MKKTLQLLTVFLLVISCMLPMNIKAEDANNDDTTPETTATVEEGNQEENDTPIVSPEVTPTVVPTTTSEVTPTVSPTITPTVTSETEVVFEVYPLTEEYLTAYGMVKDDTKSAEKDTTIYTDGSDYYFAGTINGEKGWFILDGDSWTKLEIELPEEGAQVEGDRSTSLYYFPTPVPVVTSSPLPTTKVASSYTFPLTNNNNADSQTKVDTATIDENWTGSSITDIAVHNYKVNLAFENYDHDTNRAADKWDNGYYQYEITEHTVDLSDANTTTGTPANNNVNVPVALEHVTKFLNVYPVDTQFGTLMTNNNSWNGITLFSMDYVEWDTFFANPTAYLKDGNDWKYDGIYFGAWDSNGLANADGTGLNGKDFKGTGYQTILTNFIDSGRAVVMGHDVPALYGAINHINANNFFTPYFGNLYDEGVFFGNAFGSASTQVYISDDTGNGTVPSSVQTSGNSFTTWPHNFNEGSMANVSATHMLIPTSVADDKVNIWATFAQGNSIGTACPAVMNTTPGTTLGTPAHAVTNCQIDNGVITGEIDGQRYYLNVYMYSSKDYPNVAMSQVGHTRDWANSDDAKLTVDMMMAIAPAYNKPQLVEDRIVRDSAAPDAPTITLNQPITINNVSSVPFTFEAKDNGTTLTYGIQQTEARALEDADGFVQTNTVLLQSDTQRYIYKVDTNPTGTLVAGTDYTVDTTTGLVTVAGDAEEVFVTELNGASNEIIIDATDALDHPIFVHVIALDRANNISEVETYDISSVAIDPPVNKTVSGMDIKTNELYSFTLKATDPLFALPQGGANGSKTVSKRGVGSVEFGEITFFTEGTYTYKINENKGTTWNCIYDTSVYTLTVEVTKDPITFELSAVTTITKNGSTVGSANFNNDYTELKEPVGRTCQDDGYPAGYYWDPDKEACVFGVPNTGVSDDSYLYITLLFGSLIAIGYIISRKHKEA